MYKELVKEAFDEGRYIGTEYASERFKTVSEKLSKNESVYDFGEYAIYNRSVFCRIMHTLPLIVRDEQGRFVGRYDNKKHAAETLNVEVKKISVAINNNTSVNGVKFFYAA